MAFGIDDLLATGAAGVNLSDTLVRVVRDRSKSDLVRSGDLESLFAEVKIAAIKNIDEAHVAVNDLERTLREKGVDLDQPLLDAIGSTSFFRPFEAFRLRRAKRLFENLAEDAYRACDDIAAILRCSGDERIMGGAVVESSGVKREFQQMMFEASSQSIRSAIELLRDHLEKQKSELSR